MEVSTTVPQAAAALRADAGVLAAAVTDRLRSQLPSYAAVSADLLCARVERAVRNGLSAVERMCHGGMGTAASHELGRDRGAGGRSIGDTLPVEDVISAYRIGVDVVWSRFSQEMTERRATAEELLPVAECVWSWAGAVTLRIVRRRRADAPLRPDADRQREALLRRLLLHPDALTPAQAAAVGLDESAAWLPFRARALSGDGDPVQIVEQLRPWIASAPAGDPLATVLDDGEVGGLLVSRPAGVYRRLAVGLAAAAGPTEVAAEFARATQALRTAVSFRLVGAFTSEELGLRTTVVAEPALGERLIRQRLAPLRERGEDGTQLEEAVAAYLEHGMRLEAAARSLYVHPNTLRNRLRRFEELSGTSLRDPADLAEVWWALAHQRVHGRSV